MTDEKIERVVPRDGVEERSLGKALYDGAMATGAVTGGAGTLALGAAAVKQAFGKKQEPPPPQKGRS